jgi:DNA-binding response OmpR family regulator
MAVALEVLSFTRRMKTETTVLIDRRTQELVSPDGLRRVPLPRLLFKLLDALTRDMGAVVARQAIVDVLWLYEQDVVDTLGLAHNHVARLRDAMVSVGWTREVIVTRNGVGWQIDTDEVERLMR